jgi:hypothetical protein
MMSVSVAASKVWEYSKPSYSFAAYTCGPGRVSVSVFDWKNLQCCINEIDKLIQGTRQYTIFIVMKKHWHGGS